jgi:hypothetical protein
MNIKIGIANLLVFLKDTNIYIRKWFLEREGEGRGEGVEREVEREERVEREEGMERA